LQCSPLPRLFFFITATRELNGAGLLAGFKDGLSTVDMFLRGFDAADIGTRYLADIV